MSQFKCNEATVELVEGTVAPKYDTGKEIGLKKVVITEQGTQSRLPLVDFVMTDSNGNQYLLVLSGRIINTISAAIKGVNLRNHGIEEP